MSRPLLFPQVIPPVIALLSQQVDANSEVIGKWLIDVELPSRISPGAGGKFQSR